MKQVSSTNNSAVTGRGPYSICRSVALLFGVLVIMASCQKSPVKKTVPLEATFQTTLTNVQMADEVLPELDSVYGTGQGTPIGKSTFAALAKYTPPDFNLTGNGVITSENGDRIFASIEGMGPVIDSTGAIVLTYNATIIGGTGRYMGATGGWVTIAHASIYTTTGIDSLKGTITY